MYLSNFTRSNFQSTHIHTVTFYIAANKQCCTCTCVWINKSTFSPWTDTRQTLFVQHSSCVLCVTRIVSVTVLRTKVFQCYAGQERQQSWLLHNSRVTDPGLATVTRSDEAVVGNLWSDSSFVLPSCCSVVVYNGAMGTKQRSSNFSAFGAFDT